MPERYTLGHHESVLRSHRWRTASNSAAYLLPHLGPGLDLLVTMAIPTGPLVPVGHEVRRRRVAMDEIPRPPAPDAWSEPVDAVDGSGAR